MGKIQRSQWGLIIVAFLIAGIATSASAQTPGKQYFPETNHTISGEFLTFYRSIADPFLILGYPITEADRDPVTGIEMQYFQLGRLELQPDAPTGEQVNISTLGELLYTPGAPLADVPTDGPACRTFGATGNSVCYAFLQFYDAHQGSSYFGDPISQLEVRDGRYVQYFQKARMEWRPEAPVGHRVGLTDLGRNYYDLVQSRRPKPLDGGNTIGVMKLNVRAFVEHPLMQANGQQTVYIIVQDQALNPVPQAITSVKITLPGGRQEYYRPASTDQNGVSIFNFNVGSLEVKEMVNVEVTATILGLEQHTNTWFRIWW